MVALFDIQIMSSDIQIMSKRKLYQLLQLILKSRHKPINKMDLQIYELLLLKRKQQLNNSLQTTMLKLMLLGPFQTWNLLYECRTPILVDQSN